MTRFATIGSNFVTDSFLEAAQGVEGFQLEGVYSRTRARAEEFAAKWGAPRTYTSLDALCADPAIEAVYVASPNACHEAQTIALLKAGKHVLCEKPIAPDSAALARMARAARETGRVLMEAMMPAHTPAYRAIRAAMAQIAPVRRATLRFCKYSSRYDKFKAGIVENAFDPSLANGALMDIGVYCLHAAQLLLGEPQTVAGKSVFLPGGIDGAGSLVLGYDGALAEIVYSKITDSVSPSEIEGEGGSILIDAVSRPRRAELVLRGGARREIPLGVEADEMRYEIEDFLALLRGADGARYLADSEAVTRTLDRARAGMGVEFRRR